MKIDLGLASSWLFPSVNFQFRTETFLSIFLGWLEWPARFWEVQAVGNVVKISIQQRWASGNKHPRKPLQNHRYADLWAERPNEMVSGRHIKDNKNGKQLNFSFSKIWWASKDSLLAIGNDCVARSYRFSVPLTCTRAIIRQKVYWWLNNVPSESQVIFGDVPAWERWQFGYKKKYKFCIPLHLLSKHIVIYLEAKTHN